MLSRGTHQSEALHMQNVLGQASEQTDQKNMEQIAVCRIIGVRGGQKVLKHGCRECSVRQIAAAAG